MFSSESDDDACLEEHLRRGSHLHHSVKAFASSVEAPPFPASFFVVRRAVLSRAASASSSQQQQQPLLFVAEIHSAEATDVGARAFRVVSRLGTAAQLLKGTSRDEFRPTATLSVALCVFASLVRERKGRVHRFTQLALGAASSAAPSQQLLLHADVAALLSAAATAAAQQLAASPSSSSDALGGASLSPSQVDRAVAVLRRIRVALADGKSAAAADDLSREFFAELPTAASADGAIDTPEKLERWFETCQLLQVLHGVGEAAIDLSRADDTAALYGSLGCDIALVQPESAEHTSVVKLVMRNAASDSRFGAEVQRVFRVTRPTERHTEFATMAGQELLFHGTKASNVLGVLARGLRLPEFVVAQLGVQRTNAGLLGSGLYFANDVCTALQYTTPFADRNTRIVFLCRVALGKSFRTRASMPELERAPGGFDSVHWTKEEDGDEFCIYDERQQTVQYMLELSASSMPSQAQAPEPPLPTSAADRVLRALGFKGRRAQVQDRSQGVVKRKKTAPAPADRSRFGLKDAVGSEVRLDETRVLAKIVDFLTEVSVFQSYTNASSSAIEAKYVFPADEKSAVTGFEAWINQKHVIGVVREKEQAREEYREAVERGDGAYLLEEAPAGNAFTVSIGNVPARTTVVIKIKYVTEITAEGDLRNFVFPAALAPRQAQESLATVTQTTTRTAEASASKGHFSLEVTLSMPYLIQSVSSQSHTILVKKTATKAVVRWGEQVPPSTDFTLSIKIGDLRQPYLWIEESAGHPNAAMLVLYPHMEPRLDDISENIIVVDSSNSMQSCLSDTRLVAAQLIDGIPQFSPFNLFVFGSSFESQFMASTRKTDTTAAEAMSMLRDSVDAKHGASNLWQALAAVFLEIEARKTAEKDTNVFVVSDGDWPNAGAVMQLTHSHCTRTGSRTRVFVVGMGDFGLKANISKLARIGCGAAEFVNSGAPLDNQAEKQLLRAKRGSFSNIEALWSNGMRELFAQQSPPFIRTLFSGERAVVYALVPPDCTAVSVTADDNNSSAAQALHTMVSASPATKTSGLLLHSLCARALVRDWEDGADDTLEKEQQKQAITELAIEYSLATSLTSFIAIEERSEEEKLRQQQSWSAAECTTPPISELSKGILVDEIPFCTRWERLARALPSTGASKYKLSRDAPVVHPTVYDFWRPASETEKLVFAGTINVRTLTGKTITTTASGPERTMKVSDLKQKIRDAEGIPASQQRLVKNGRLLSDNDTVLAGDCVHMVLRLRGAEEARDSAAAPSRSRKAHAEKPRFHLHRRMNAFKSEKAACCESVQRGMTYEEMHMDYDRLFAPAGCLKSSSIAAPVDAWGAAPAELMEQLDSLQHRQQQQQQQQQSSSSGVAPKMKEEKQKASRPQPPAVQNAPAQRPPQADPAPPPSVQPVSTAPCSTVEMLCDQSASLSAESATFLRAANGRLSKTKGKKKKPPARAQRERARAAAPISTSKPAPTTRGPYKATVNLGGSQFCEHAEATIGAAFQTVPAKVGGASRKLQFWDTAGQERYRSLAPMFYRGAEAALVMFDLSRRDTLDDAKRWIEELRARASPDITIVLLGNKLDLQRQVTFSEANRVAHDLDVPYFEISCKTREGIEAALLAFYEDLFSWSQSPEPKVVFLGASAVGKSTLGHLISGGSVALPDPSRLHALPRRNARRPQPQPQQRPQPAPKISCTVL